MASPHDPQTPITDALSLWELLKRKGGLATSSHDAGFVASLRQSLGIANGGDIAAFLRHRPMDAGTFMIAVLTALEPFGLILSQTYAMFERHGVKGSKEGLLLQFDFGAAEGKLGFDANHFRRAMASVRGLQQTVAVHRFHRHDLWAVAEVLRACLLPEGDDYHALPEDAAARAWLGEAQALPDGWPYGRPAPLPPAEAGNELRQAMTPLLHAAALAFARQARYASRDQMLKAAGADTLVEPGESTRGGLSEWSERSFGFAQSDLLAVQLLRLCWRLYERYPAPSSMRAQVAQRIALVIAQHSEIGIRQDPRQQLEELLDLPWWQQRHQLYSVWLVTVVEAAVQDPLSFSLRPVDGRLEFSFKATPIANIEGAASPIELIAELYTDGNGVALQGKSREHGIQPDYVLQHGDAPDAAIYVLEAKQYAKPSRSNFAAALHDYAAVHRGACVALANYGPMTQDLETSLRELLAKSGAGTVDELLARCQAFGHVEPSRHDEVARLVSSIRASLAAQALPVRPLIVIDASYSMLGQLPEHLDDPEVAALWAAVITHPDRQLMAVNDDGVEDLSHSASPLTLLAGLRRSIRAGIGLPRELPPLQPHAAALLVTDLQGFEETRAQHFKYLAVLVLDGSHWPRLHRAPASDAVCLELAFPGLAACCDPGPPLDKAPS